MTQHPSNFYVAHRLYSGRGFPLGPVWGAFTDGPADRTEMLDLVMDSFRDEAPTFGNLRVWWFQDDVSPRDVTEDFITAWEVENARPKRKWKNSAAAMMQTITRICLGRRQHDLHRIPRI